jgi:hypothetical protein
MTANEIIDSIADRLGYSRSAFKDVVPTKSRFNALLGTLSELSPQEISEALSAYDTYIGNERQSQSATKVDNDNEGDSPDEINEEVQSILNRLQENQNQDLSEILDHKMKM